MVPEIIGNPCDVILTSGVKRESNVTRQQSLHLRQISYAVSLLYSVQSHQWASEHHLVGQNCNFHWKSCLYLNMVQNSYRSNNIILKCLVQWLVTSTLTNSLSYLTSALSPVAVTGLCLPLLPLLIPHLFCRKCTCVIKDRRARYGVFHFSLKLEFRAINSVTFELTTF